jgi:glycosyltransferase involved in cell wall biosynthesis
VPLSFVIPTYNRETLVGSAIDSALDWIKQLGDGEIIIVDDASTDETLSFIKSTYSAAIEASTLRIVALPKNAGVTAAKNAGGLVAKQDWIVFLDSDDALIPSSAEDALHCLERYAAAPCVMFRCIDVSSGALIGERCDVDVAVSLRDYLNNWHFGECLPVVRKAIFCQSPYDADLRGFEGLAYLRMLKNHGNMVVSTVIARAYTTTGADRLSAPAAIAKRARLLAKGHLRVFTEFATVLSPYNLVRQLAKTIYYFAKALG